jgi:hypothetical protein
MFTDMQKRYRDKFTVGFTYHADCYCYKCGEQLPEIGRKVLWEGAQEVVFALA